MAGGFALDLRKFAEKAGKRADAVVGELVGFIAAEIDYRSPVGDAKYWKSPAPKGYVGGRFRANWQLGIGTLVASTTTATDHSAKSRDKGGVTTGRIIAAIPEKAAGKVYWLSNSLPYAQRIEDGWSRNQAPQGVVGITTTHFQASVNKAVEAAKARHP